MRAASGRGEGSKQSNKNAMEKKTEEKNLLAQRERSPQARYSADDRAGPCRIVIEHLQGNCARGGPQAQPAADYWEEQFKKYEENNKRK